MKNKISGAVILIVDDDEIILRILEKFFSKQGCTVVTAQNGNEGFKCFSQELFDCVVTDLEMPEIDGMEFIRLIRDVSSGIPIVLMTGSPDYMEKCDFSLADFNEIILKPFDLKTLLTIVEKRIMQTQESEIAKSANSS